MAGPTQALVSLHGAGRNDTYGAALLDVQTNDLSADTDVLQPTPSCRAQARAERR